MDSVLNVSPGLMIWTIINFGIFLALFVFLFYKPIKNSLNARENKISTDIENAEKANEEAKKFLKETEEKFTNAQKEMSEIILKGKQQAEAIMKKAAEEAEKTKRAKVEEAIIEIERSKEKALLELRSEVAGLVVKATESILGEVLDKDKHYKLAESYIDKLPKN